MTQMTISKTKLPLEINILAKKVEKPDEILSTSEIWGFCLYVSWCHLKMAWSILMFYTISESLFAVF